MKKNYLILVLLWIVTIPVFSQVSNDNEDGVYKVDSRMGWDDFVPGQVLVKFKDNSNISVKRVKGKFQAASVSAVNAVLHDFGVYEMEQLLPRETPNRPLRKAKAFNGEYVEERNLSQLYFVKFESMAPDSVLLLVDALKELPQVEYAEPNYKVYMCADPNNGDPITTNYEQNPLSSQQWYLDYEGLPELWSKPIVNNKRPVIAILDTGVDITHPDLVDNIWTNEREADGEDGYDNDNNGYKNDLHGWDFINNTSVIRDYNSHGTHVAGIAAAVNNSTGIIGANPYAYIMPITIMQSDGTGDVATIARGIDYAINNGATILNMSFGTSNNSVVLRQALATAYQTAVLVAAAGNNGVAIYPECGLSATIYPAAYSFVLGVQATTQNGNRAGFSNYDCDGPTYSVPNKDIWGERIDNGVNYELSAPGVNILSSIPNGNYKKMNGTSMSAPLMAGGISALQMVKEYNSQEILWGDLIHSSNLIGAYNIEDRPAELELITILMNDSLDGGNGDQMYDSGETVRLYPVIKTTWGKAENIRLNLSVAEYEDPSLVNISTNNVDFGWTLTSYGKQISANPIVLTISDQCPDARHIRLKLTATCDNSSQDIACEFPIVVNNVVKISGVIAENMTLESKYNYFVTQNIGIPEGVTLTIEPGTTIKFATNMGISVSGKINAKGTPERPINFISYDQQGKWAGISNSKSQISDTLDYCHLDNFKWGERVTSSDPHLYFKNCLITQYQGVYLINFVGEKNNVLNSNGYGISYLTSYQEQNNDGFYSGKLVRSNIINNRMNGTGYDAVNSVPTWSSIKQDNYFNNYNQQGNYSLKNRNKNPTIMSNEAPSYLGSIREDLIKPLLFVIENGCDTYGSIDLSNMLTEPVAEAHGIVWKVIVDGYDAQDEYEEMPPLGVGNHVFQVYFNRPMNKNVAPQISFGVREPYTQVPVNLNGRWSSDGKIYTAFVKITGKTSSDGYNTIYVYGAEDDEFFEIPYEKTRFHINVQSAGSMATGFSAEAGMGKVNLTWNNDENDFEDAMGFNIYRYTEETIDNPTRINEEIVDIETTAYTDYDVTPGTTYYYLYRVLSTDLQEYDASNVVAVTPLTSSKGDANGSGDVDVADVITTVNYASGQQPKPFIFEAADMNDDQSIDILDVIGIIKQIMNPNAEAKPSIAAVATYTIEDGVVYVDSPVEIAGVQIQLATSSRKDIRVAEDMKGFEHTSAWLSDNDYLFLGYNMNGKTLTTGKHAILIIDDAQIADIRLSDAYGHNIQAVSNTVDKIDRMARDVMTVNGIYDLQGRKITGNTNQLSKLPKGVYIVNGQKVVR